MSKKKMEQWKTGFIFVFPSLIFIFTFMIYPLISAGYLSFYQYSPLISSEVSFVGLQNYEWSIKSDIVLHSLYVTILFTIASVVLEFLFGLFIAVLLHKQLKGKFSKIRKFFIGMIRSAFILPFATPTVVAAVAFKMLFHAQFGPINAIINSLVGIKIAWLTEYPLLCIVIADTWKMTPFILFILFAAIMSIPTEQFEAIRIDGASSWQEFRYITWPSVMPVAIVILAFRAIDAFTKIFDVVYMMTGGGPAMGTQVFPLLIWKIAFTHLHFGRASALIIIATIISTFLGIILLLKRRPK
jgi:multiple sugar transport system permease protein